MQFCSDAISQDGFLGQAQPCVSAAIQLPVNSEVLTEGGQLSVTQNVDAFEDRRFISFRSSNCHESLKTFKKQNSAAIITENHSADNVVKYVDLCLFMYVS